MAEPEKPKRRKEKKSEMLDVRLPYEMKQRLIKAARKNGQTVSQAVRTMISFYIEESETAENKPKQGVIAMIVKRHPGKTLGILGSGLAALLALTASPSLAQSDRDAQPINLPDIEYPEDMLAVDATADCIARFNVTADGYPEDITSDCSHEGFEDAVIAAVWTLRFEPKLAGGAAVPRIGVEYPFRFQISEDADCGPEEYE